MQPVEFIHRNITFQDSAADLCQKVFETNQAAVENTRRALDPAMVEVAAKAIAEARRIDIYGVGYSHFSGLDAKLKLVRFGLTADAYGDPHLQVMAAVSPARRRGDRHFAPGSTRTWWMLGPARKSGATTIAITNYSLSRSREWPMSHC